MANPQTNGRTLPNDTNAEQALLGLVMDRGHIPTVAEALTPADFYQPVHETLWATILQLHTNQKPATYVSVRAHLQEHGQLDVRGGVPSQTIIELTNTHTAEDPAHLTEIIQDRALRRHIITWHERGLQHAYTSPDAAHEQLHRIEEQATQLASLTQHASPLLTNLRTADWLANQIFPPLHWVVPGLLPEGMSLLIGAPKIGKSWLSLSIALAVAAGGYALGHIHVGKPRQVLLLALEDSHRRLQNRITNLLKGDQFPPHLHYLTDLKPDQLIPTIQAWLHQQPADATPLIILDTLGKVMPPTMLNESQYQRDYRIAGQLKRIADNHNPGTALLVLHHDRKTVTDDFVDSVSGTNGIAGAADTIMVIQRPRNETRGLLKITGRDVEESEYAIEIKDGNWDLIGGNLTDAAQAAQTIHATVNLGDRSAEIVRFVAAHPEGATGADVADELGMSPKDARTYLMRLFDAGRLQRPRRGVYTPVATVVSVVNEQPSETTQTTYATGDIGRAREEPSPFAELNLCRTCLEPLNQPSQDNDCRDQHTPKD